MQSCPKCKIRIRGNKRCCPLCQGVLTGEPEDPAFPSIPQKKVSSVSLFKIGLFACVLVEIVMGILSYVTDFRYGVFGFVMTIAPLCLFDFAVVTYYRGNIFKLITAESWLIMLACYLADVNTGFHGWSLAWVIPIGFVVLTVVILILGKTIRNHLMEYVIYPFVNILLSLLQFIPIAKGMNPFPLPAVICEGLLVAVAAYILIFRFRDLTNASSRYLNL